MPRSLKIDKLGLLDTKPIMSDSRSITSVVNGRLGGRPRKINEEFYINGEIWKFIEEYPRYMVSNKGRVLSTKYGSSFLYRTVKRNGYVAVLITESGKQMTKMVHQFVAKAFVDNPENKPQVDHIDGDKTNNNSSNLRWVTSSENLKSYRLKSNNCSSKYRGVTWDKSRNKWKASICSDGVRKNIGRFDKEYDAAMAYNIEACKLNFNIEALNELCESH